MAIHGKPLNETRELAKQVVMFHFVSLGEKDKVPPTLRAMYAIKVAQAQMYLANIESDPAYQSLNRCIEKDAEQRGYSTYQMAIIILYMAGESLDLEDQRLSVNVRIENAASEKQISAILAEYGLSLSIDLRTP